ncbi:Alpha/Beta hydrolase protein [Gloeopeniophorella convolvens]|nr:Alpha/Beta hydrolase protein [Gloeopeniophorella convolvens]
MDPAATKKHTTTRGFTYSYYCATGQEDKPTLIFLHGFPGNANGWRNQIPFFQSAGFGLIVPDMLGYAGTDKPVEPEVYVGTGLSQDIVDIVDVECIKKPILINDWPRLVRFIASSHSRGSRVVSRLANFYPERLLAYAFVSVGYSLPQQAPYSAEALPALYRNAIGREAYGYWEFFSADDAAHLIEDHIDSFYSVFFPNPPTLWEENIAPTGEMRKWVESDRKSGLPNYLTEQEKQDHLKVLLEGGFTAPLNWYKVGVAGDGVDTKYPGIPAEGLTTTKPVMFVGCSKDGICISSMMHDRLGVWAKGPLTLREYDADHWVMLSHGDELNRDFLEWISTIPD